MSLAHEILSCWKLEFSFIFVFKWSNLMHITGNTGISWKFIACLRKLNKGGRHKLQLEKHFCSYSSKKIKQVDIQLFMLKNFSTLKSLKLLNSSIFPVICLCLILFLFNTFIKKIYHKNLWIKHPSLENNLFMK